MAAKLLEPCPYLFVYGSLRLGCGNAMAALLARQADWLCLGVIQARLYDLGDYPGALPSEDAHDRVFGDLFYCGDNRQLFAVLDDYEECAPHHPKPHEYRRQVCPVRLPDNATLQAWVYFYNGAVDDKPQIISGDYLP